MNDPWQVLRRYTQARIGQGRAGCALPTAAQLEFQLAHAAARDAVLQAWSPQALAESVAAMDMPSLILATQAGDRQVYLRRPDLGRQLAAESHQHLAAAKDKLLQPVDVTLIVSNGLSTSAVEAHAPGLLQAVLQAYRQAGLQIAPLCLLADARVAVADEIGALLGARLAVIVVGERPGLSAADSLGIYLTYAPQPGKTDAERNCISNIRPPHGLSYAAAAATLRYLSEAALLKGISGVALKDDMPPALVAGDTKLIAAKP
ncbi:ethanolamine ammonia-lyase subunit EutC [Methylomonas rhizoryzae]|uniref:ethanolamine ammonia-lyase subunit EutC n=1 Tax=Methylomonas rhizoryzae TaxID=2608981 RepID=UPI0012327335|nr:ethanolamine ammonia-lyase subunit EutC [Methylomonas rhizoryzae]